MKLRIASLLLMIGLGITPSFANSTKLIALQQIGGKPVVLSDRSPTILHFTYGTSLYLGQWNMLEGNFSAALSFGGLFDVRDAFNVSRRPAYFVFDLVSFLGVGQGTFVIRDPKGVVFQRSFLLQGDPVQGSITSGTQTATVPEPSTYVLMFTGLLTIMALAMRRRKSPEII